DDGRALGKFWRLEWKAEIDAGGGRIAQARDAWFPRSVDRRGGVPARRDDGDTRAHAERFVVRARSDGDEIAGGGGADRVLDPAVRRVLGSRARARGSGRDVEGRGRSGPDRQEEHAGGSDESEGAPDLYENLHSFPPESAPPGRSRRVRT